MKMFTRGIGAALIFGLLASCSTDENGPGSYSKQVLGSIKEVVATRREGPRQQTVVTPAMLAQTTAAALQVNPESRGGSDFLRRIAVRNDSSIGTVEIWKSSDNAQIFLRDGIVVGTRGVGGDIIAADANMTVRALRSRADAGGVRHYAISDGDVTVTDYQFHCTVQNLGSEKISVVNLVFSTDHLREKCVSTQSGYASIQNDYWVQYGTGRVRKSRQWMGPATGYFELILLKD